MKRDMVLICFITLFCNALFADGIYIVGEQRPVAYGSIQAAVDAASSGDTIKLDNGLYTGEGNYKITLTKDITILSGSGNPEECIIDVNGASNEYKPGFLVSGGNVTIKDITIKRGSASAG